MAERMGKSEEMRAWVASLKPGDKVIYKGWCTLSVLTVKKVTPSGIVKTTDDRSFAQRSCGNSVRGRGDTMGEIIPATSDLLAEAEKQDTERQEELRKKRVIRAAKNSAYDIGCGKIGINYEFAVEFLELLERYKREDVNAQ